VVNPEVSSVRDSDRILGLLGSKTRKAEQGERVKEHLLLTRYSPRRVETGEMLSIADVEEILGIKTLGVIPESTDVLNASSKGEPVILDADTDAAQAYDDADARLLGATRPMRYVTPEKKGLFSKIFGGSAWAGSTSCWPGNRPRRSPRTACASSSPTSAQGAAARTTCRCSSASCWRSSASTTASTPRR